MAQSSGAAAAEQIAAAETTTAPAGAAVSPSSPSPSPSLSPSPPVGYDVYFPVTNQDLVLDIQPATYHSCFIVIGPVEILILPSSLPFRSPSILNCKFKVVYDTPPSSPPRLRLRDVSQRTYDISALTADRGVVDR